MTELPEWDGGWQMPVVCTDRGRHDRELLCTAYVRTDYGVAYQVAAPEKVQQTKRQDLIGVPGRSLESIRFHCPQCPRTPTISRTEWGQILEAARHAQMPVFDVSNLNR